MGKSQSKNTTRRLEEPRASHPHVPIDNVDYHLEHIIQSFDCLLNHLNSRSMGSHLYAIEPNKPKNQVEKKKLEVLANKVDSYKCKIVDDADGKDDLSPEMMKLKSALSRKEEEIGSDYFALKRLIEKKEQSFPSSPTEKWIEEEAAILNRKLSADSDELSEHLDEVTTNLERRRTGVKCRRQLQMLDDFSSQLDRIRQLTQQSAILKALAEVEDVIDGIQKTCETRNETTSKIPPTLCGMPWNIKRIIVDSLDFSARHRLHQCSSEFKQLIDSSKIVYDRVVFSFEEFNDIHITVYQNGEKQLKLTFHCFSMSSCLMSVNDNREPFVRQYDYYIPVALPYLLQKINRPNVTIRELEVHFYKCDPQAFPEQWHKNRVIVEMTRLLSFARLSNIEAPKIRAKCFRLKHHGSEDFLRSFLPFLDKNTLEHVSLAYNSTTKKEEYMLAVKMTGYETCITTPIVTVDQLKHVVQMMMNTNREHYLMRHTESFNGPLYNYLSQWPIDPLGRMNSRMLPIPNSTDYLSVEIFMNDVFIKRVFA